MAGRRVARVEPTNRCATGIVGFDEITGGGLPQGRVTVVVGGAGSGKTIFSLQVLVRGARLGQPGIFVAFEESADEIVANASSFTWRLPELRGKGLEFFDAQISQTVLQGGDFDLIGLLAMLGAKAKRLGARTIVFDGIDVLLGPLGDPALVRREVFRIREWLRTSGMTGILTAKSSAHDLRPTTDYDFLEFMADCVVVLGQRVVAGTTLRVLRVSKYRGNGHSTNEQPFTMTSAGMEVAGGTSTLLDYPISPERITSGVPRLDAMLGGGYYRGTSVLISGAPGTAKTILASVFADAACRRQERTVYVSFDEAPAQVVRNVASVGVHLGPHLDSGVLWMCARRTRAESAEAHVARIGELAETLHARNIVVDPLSALAMGFHEPGADQAALQVLDLAKTRGITVVGTSLLSNATPLRDETPTGVSTIVDTWMHVSYVSQGGERNRALSIIKSRGTHHSNQVRELVLSDAGVSLTDVYTVRDEVLMGTMRWQKENDERLLDRAALREAQLRQKTSELMLAETKARIEVLRTEQGIREAELRNILLERQETSDRDATELRDLVVRRAGDSEKSARPPARARRVPAGTVRAR
jgi:circadian clock protein KaiC